MSTQHILRPFLAAVAVVLMIQTSALAADAPALTSPGKRIAARVAVDADGRLTLTVLRNNQAIMGASTLGVTVGGQDLGLNVETGQPASREISETFGILGGKRQAVNHCVAYDLPITHKPTGQPWTLEVRVFNDGVAWRYRIPGAGRRHITGEATAWQLPPEATVWLQNDTRNYEGAYHRQRADQIPQKNDKGNLYIGCPLTVELPQGGYALITEGCLYRYSGMTLRPLGSAKLAAAFEDDPQGWDIDGMILSPWRVTLVADNLNALVNSDLILSLGEKPDPKLFPDGAKTSWIRPGKGVCTWTVFYNDGAQWHRQKWFVDTCAAMGCEYLLLDGGWRTEKWGFRKDNADEWARLKELCDYAATKNLGVMVWHAYPEGRDDSPGLTRPEAREEFFRRCKAAGVKGVKIDFFDSESKTVIDVYEDILRRTAEHQLMISFHGANKPTGETRTWPHEITREGIREQEYVLWEAVSLEHYAALPFTRMVVGHGDFLPTYVRPQFLRNTTATFQLATAVIYTSPFICWPDHPDAYLESPFLSILRTMPPVWDETRVLDGSVIGRRVIFARRAGNDWYLAMLNCENAPVTQELDLSFLGDGDYQATLYHDNGEPRTALRIEAGRTLKKGGKLTVQLQPAGGFVAKISRPAEYTK